MTKAKAKESRPGVIIPQDALLRKNEQEINSSAQMSIESSHGFTLSARIPHSGMVGYFIPNTVVSHHVLYPQICGAGTQIWSPSLPWAMWAMSLCWLEAGCWTQRAVTAAASFPASGTTHSKPRAVSTQSISVGWETQPTGFATPLGSPLYVCALFQRAEEREYLALKMPLKRQMKNYVESVQH